MVTARSIGYLPAGQVLGLSKFARIARGHARRLQMQEMFADGVAQDVVKATGSGDIGVMAEGEHLCMSMRGVREQQARTTSMKLLPSAPRRASPGQPVRDAGYEPAMNAAPGQGPPSAGGQPARRGVLPGLVPARPAVEGSLLTGPAACGRNVVRLTWPHMQELAGQVADRADRDGAPQTVVAGRAGARGRSAWHSPALAEPGDLPSAWHDDRICLIEDVALSHVYAPISMHIRHWQSRRRWQAKP
jgi:hypothetical protein